MCLTCHHTVFYSRIQNANVTGISLAVFFFFHIINGVDWYSGEGAWIYMKAQLPAGALPARPVLKGTVQFQFLLSLYHCPFLEELSR